MRRNSGMPPCHPFMRHAPRLLVIYRSRFCMRIRPPFLSILTLCALAVFAGLGPLAGAAEYQWSVPVQSVTSEETNDHPRAFLWIPPDCQRVRAVIVGQHNMLEEGILEHPSMRRTLAELGMAAVWVSPAFDGNFRFDRG